MKIDLSNSVIESVSTRKDRSLKIVLWSPELPPDQMAAIFSVMNTDVVEVSLPEESRKYSQSQILRFAIDDLYKTKYTDKYQNKEQFYQIYMQQIIDWVNKKTND